MIQNLVAFTVAAILEILGCFTFWLWLRRGASPGIGALGILSLIGFAVALTRVDAAFAGRAYAAYGGIYIAASLVCYGSWKVSSQRRLTCSVRASPSLVRSSSLAWPFGRSRLFVVGVAGSVPGIVPAARQNRLFQANGSQLARSVKWKKEKDLRGKTKEEERLIDV